MLNLIAKSWPKICSKMGSIKLIIFLNYRDPIDQKFIDIQIISTIGFFKILL
jgi:hypothetical protein